MRSCPELKRRPAGLTNLVGILAVSCFCLAVLVGSTKALTRPSSGSPGGDARAEAEPERKPRSVKSGGTTKVRSGKSKEKTKSHTKVDGKESLERQNKARPTSTHQADGRAKARAAAKASKKRAVFAMEPNAKWVCDETVVTLEPVWRGKTTLTFPFDIRNEGTASLRIRAKGG